MTGAVAALAILAVDALVLTIAAAAFARFIHEDDWRVESRWARRPRVAAAIERLAFFRLDSLRALILWLVVGAVLTAFAGVPALFYLLGQL